MNSNNRSDPRLAEPAPGAEPIKRDVLGWLSPWRSQARWVERVRRPLRRNYLALALVLLGALIGVVLLTVWQRSPVITAYALGWYLPSAQVGYTFNQLASDSPLQPPSDPDHLGFERHLFALINKARQERGLPLLRFNENLSRAAQTQAHEMARSRRFVVLDENGKLPAERAESAGYLQPTLVLELVGAGLQRPDQLVAALTADPNAAQNLFSPHVNEVGTGYAYASNDPAYRHYWVIDLGRRGVPAYTVVVNGGAKSTPAREVTLQIGGKGWARQIQVSNAPDFGDATWEVYAETKTWTLSESPGLKKVYVRLRGIGGEQVTIVGEITLSPP